ncbi:MAG: hypothetical protein Q4G42_02475 [Neisseria sp.]|nr:hypothetical protein [Neisseria sp.]
MTERKKYLTAAILMTVLFMLFVLCGSLLFGWGYRRWAMICLLPALLAMGGQMFSVLMLSRTSNSSDANVKKP